MAENRRLYGLDAPRKEPHQPKPHPFKATYRHERWCLDIRYIEKHQIPEIKGSFYVITVMDAFSRAILSSDIFQGQDLACVLIVLYEAREQFGTPRYLITDNGAVFRAKQLLAICEALEIEKEYIHPRQSWENLVETHFNLMRRMSQVHFEQVTSWEGAKLAHERFVTDYNAQPRLSPIANVRTTASVPPKCWAGSRTNCAPRNNCIGFFMRRAFSAAWIGWVMPIFVAGSSMEKRRWPAIMPSFSCTVMH